MPQISVPWPLRARGVFACSLSLALCSCAVSEDVASGPLRPSGGSAGSAAQGGSAGTSAGGVGNAAGASGAGSAATGGSGAVSAGTGGASGGADVGGTSAGGPSSGGAVAGGAGGSGASSATGGAVAGGAGGAGAGGAGGSGGGGSGGCPGAVVDWDWNAGTAPGTAQLTFSDSTWSVGPASSGPNDGQTYLATNPAGNYPAGADSWVMLPTIDLAPYSNCSVSVSVELWRRSEVIISYFDGGNLQATTASSPGVGSSWSAVPGLNYDGVLDASFSCGNLSSCLVFGQQVWSGDATPRAKTATTQLMPAPTGSWTPRFTFHSDSSSQQPGLYIKRLSVAAN